jgi:hypothetical protein
MSFDLFVGSPGSRIIRKRELLQYYEFETDAEQNEARDANAILPAISQFALEPAKEWPAMNPAGPLVQVSDDPDDNRLTVYGFGPTSLYLCFSWSRQEEAREKVRELALRHGLLFFNCSGFDWINAIGDPARGRSGKISLVEEDQDGSGDQKWSGATSWIEPGDADLLTEPDWFKPKSYFAFELEEQHYMQSYNAGNYYLVEYRRGSPDMHFQATTKSIEIVRKSLNLYCQGSEEAFKLLKYKKLKI